MNIKIFFVFSVFYLLSVDANVPTDTFGKEVRRRGRLRHGQRNQTVHHIDEEIDEDPSDVYSLLHKITDKLTEISLITNQHLRRLESLEYKITKMEVQIQEKTDQLRLETKEVSRRAQQLDWQSSKTEQTLDTLRADTTFLKQALEHMRISSFNDREVVGVTDSGLEVSNKIQMTLRSVQSLQKDVSTLQTDISLLKSNVTNITTSTSSLDTLLPSLLTTQHFRRALLDFDRRTYQPVCPASHSVNNKWAEDVPQDCSEIQSNKSGVYRVKPPHASSPFFVYCDMETSDGGWTVIQHRPDGTVDFYKDWHDYKFGFGNIGREHWLGLEKLHLLTNYKVNELYIELEDFALTKSYAHYTAFSVGSEVEGYPISFLAGYDGNAGDSLIYHAGQKFSTFDMDHDNWPEGNCAKSHTGAWWYNGCDTSNLNGKYLNGELPEQYNFQGMYWYEFQGPQYSLKSSKMMVRPRKDKSLEEVFKNSEE